MNSARAAPSAGLRACPATAVAADGQPRTACRALSTATSRCSLRQLSSRRGDSEPSAQRGRHRAARLGRRAGSRRTGSARPARRCRRTPGPARRRCPAGRRRGCRACPAPRRRRAPGPGSGTRWCAGPCRPRARIACTGITSAPARALTRVDLPAPERPEQRQRAARRDQLAQRVEALRRACTLTGSTGTSGASSASCRATAAGSAAVSLFDSTSTGCAPDSQASASSRSIAGVVRRRVHRLDHRDRVHVGGQHLAGGVLVRGPADQRGAPGQDTFDRGTAVRPAPQHHPVAGAGQPGRVAGGAEQHAAGQRWRGRRRSASRTVQTPRSARSTRPGGESDRSSGRYADAKTSSQPSWDRSYVMGALTVRGGGTRQAVRREPPCEGTQQRRTARFPPPPRVSIDASAPTVRSPLPAAKANSGAPQA